MVDQHWEIGVDVIVYMYAHIILSKFYIYKRSYTPLARIIPSK